LFNNFDNPKEKLKFILYIDSAKNSRVVVKDESYDGTTMYRAPISNLEYKNLLKILSSCNISSIPDDDTEIDKDSSFEILEISYNDQIKRFHGFTRLPANFSDKLAEFVCDYIELRVNINANWGWRYHIHRRN
jgi:hypothetical protein